MHPRKISPIIFLFSQSSLMGKKVPQEYVVKEIIDRRDQKLPNGRLNTFYKVLWQGYPESQATWQASRKLVQHPELKKDVQKFNDKRKQIIKLAKNQGKPKNTQNKSQSFTVIETSTLSKSQAMKKAPEPVTAQKPTKNPVASPVSKEPRLQKTQKKDEVVGLILSRIRENTDLSSSKASAVKKSDQVITEESEKKITNKVKQKISALKTNNKQQKPNAQKKNLRKPLTNQTVQDKPAQQKQITAASTIFPEPKIKISETSKQIAPIVEQNNEKIVLQTSLVKPVVSNIDQTMDSNLQDSLEQKPAEDKGNGNMQKIKLELTEQLGLNESAVMNSLKIKASQATEAIGQVSEEEFDIKGMIMCKSEYFYLVEENGKSQILSRAEILNAHPYELICFYERRINIKPAEINMMIL